ncbi:hypothetical protein [Hymenobacter cheonanensis]|uniref:hypothetical protein n=1 Tax=Hymenobacter sp. CA2-7 TaxID=3063993 RepID=UPI0027143F89|nr:hypothetical protein [Hymenobacter sp. CA2-7]MDO7885359.1 hypothetical protein [Hymenobacter sp. CA2-7]
MWSSNPAIFIFANPVPGLAPLALYQHQRGSCPDVVKQFALAHQALAPGADLGETIYQMSDYLEELFSDGSADFGERYRYLYDAATDVLVVRRRKSPSDKLGVYDRKATFGGWQALNLPPPVPATWHEEFSGSLADFLATYLPSNW